MRTSLSGCRYPRGRKSTPLTTLKIAVVAPIPSARQRTAASVKPGFFTSMRTACRRSIHNVFTGVLQGNWAYEDTSRTRHMLQLGRTLPVGDNVHIPSE